MAEMRQQLDQYRAAKMPMIEAYAARLASAYGGPPGKHPWFGPGMPPTGPAGGQMLGNGLPGHAAPGQHPYASILATTFSRDMPLYPPIPPYALNSSFAYLRPSTPAPTPTLPGKSFCGLYPTLPVPLSIPINRHREVTGPPPFALQVMNSSSSAPPSSAQDVNSASHGQTNNEVCNNSPFCSLGRTRTTVKALTLHLMETLDLFFRRACFHCNASYRKRKRMKVVEKLQIYKFGSVHFMYMIQPQKLQSLQEKVRSFHEVQS
jgi:hypothetical protein